MDKCIMANTSAIRQHAAHTTYQLSSPSCSTRAIQKSLTLNKKIFEFSGKKSGESSLAEKWQDRKSKRTRQKEKKKTREKIEKGNQMTALRFPTGGRQRTRQKQTREDIGKGNQMTALRFQTGGACSPPPKGRPGMSDVSLLSGISGLNKDLDPIFCLSSLFCFLSLPLPVVPVPAAACLVFFASSLSPYSRCPCPCCSLSGLFCFLSLHLPIVPVPAACEPGCHYFPHFRVRGTRIQPPHCICTDTHTQTALKVENPAVQILENLQVRRKKNMMTI